MKIVVTSDDIVRTAECGVIPKDIPTDVSDALGKFLIERGDAALFETKNAAKQVAAVTTTQVAALTTEQVAAVTTTQVAALTTEQVAAVTTKKK